jgi:hypothetical protein
MLQLRRIVFSARKTKAGVWVSVARKAGGCHGIAHMRVPDKFPHRNDRFPNGFMQQREVAQIYDQPKIRLLCHGLGKLPGQGRWAIRLRLSMS